MVERRRVPRSQRVHTVCHLNIQVYVCAPSWAEFKPTQKRYMVFLLVLSQYWPKKKKRVFSQSLRKRASAAKIRTEQPLRVVHQNRPTNLFLSLSFSVYQSQTIINSFSTTLFLLEPSQKNSHPLFVFLSLFIKGSFGLCYWVQSLKVSLCFLSQPVQLKTR